MATDPNTLANTAAASDEEAGRSPADVAGSGNDAFSKAFDDFASGGKADPKDEDKGHDAEAGDGGADDEGGKPEGEGSGEGGQADSAGSTPAAGSDPDPWANASPELIAARDRMAADFNTRLAGANGRASGLQRQLNAIKAGGQKPEGAAKGGGADKKSDAWVALDEKIKQFESDYPELADTLLPLLRQQRDGLANVEARVAPIHEADEAAAKAHAIEEVRRIHPDFLSFGYTPNDPDYAKWLNTQDAKIQQDNRDFVGWLSSKPESFTRMAESDDATEASTVITLFKTERAEAMRKAGGNAGETNTKPDERRQRQLDGGKQVGSRQPSAATGAPDDDFDGAFEHYQRKLEKTATRR
jgi:hypothetical protein